MAPVGLDLEAMNLNFAEVDRKQLKEKYGYQPLDKILLFVGRLTEEKRPLQVIRLFARLFQSHSEYRLLMVGSGKLKETVLAERNKYGLQEVAYLMEEVPNDKIWEIYRLSDVFVNLNPDEIFGMAILEAMYYGCKVVAWHAPGPDFIIEEGKSGYLIGSEAEALEAIEEKTHTGEAAHRRIVQKFTWNYTADIIKELAGD